ncbi:hypothetical protein [Nocardia sp. NPDC006630]|uniref:hypothetical protein n=1 Tax=Nocardia sp. NPDC006630 TaxID=3157181 RepID=UPI0033B32877
MRHSVEVMAAEYVADALTHRVLVCFERPDRPLVLEYAATRSEAWEFATAAAQVGLTVRVDRRVRKELRQLPCRRLWH